MNNSIISDSRFKEVIKLAKYMTYRPSTSDKELESAKREISLEAMRLILCGGRKGFILNNLGKLRRRNLKLRGTILNDHLQSLIKKIGDGQLTIRIRNTNVSLGLPQGKERDFLYESVKLLGRYASLRHYDKKHDQHKLSIVFKSFKVLFSSTNQQQKQARLNALRDADIAYESARGKFNRGVSVTYFDSYTLRGTLRKIIEQLSKLVEPVAQTAKLTEEVKLPAPSVSQAESHIFDNKSVVFFRATKTPAQYQREEVTELFVCPISYEIMADPVVASDGHTYDRKSIEAWFKQNTTSPLTGVKLNNLSLTPNYLVKNLIEMMGSSRFCRKAY